jgi:CPA1 family monovalent cation:H+ antiporter
LVEITLTVVTAYASFIFAEHLGMSGVLATLTAGLMVGNFGWSGAISDSGRSHVRDFWVFVAFLVNSIVFILIGTSEAHQPLGLYAAAAGVAILLVLTGRALAIYPLCALLYRSAVKVPLGYQHVLFWGGLRRALALALALGLPASIPERNEVVATAFAVVAFSIFAQGLTMPWLIARLGLSDGRVKAKETGASQF